LSARSALSKLSERETPERETAPALFPTELKRQRRNIRAARADEPSRAAFSGDPAQNPSQIFTPGRNHGRFHCRYG
jgi:hypothetical protein